jgi:hypothetical protein
MGLRGRGENLPRTFRTGASSRGLEDWLSERFRRHRANCDVVRQDLVREHGLRYRSGPSSEPWRRCAKHCRGTCNRLGLECCKLMDLDRSGALNVPAGNPTT